MKRSIISRNCHHRHRRHYHRHLIAATIPAAINTIFIPNLRIMHFLTELTTGLMMVSVATLRIIV